MAQEDIAANVVLTADTSQYDAAMGSSATATDSLGASVEALTKKMGDITRSAGKKLIGIGVADVAAITAGTVAWASYEKQMSSLNAQAKVLSTSQNQQAKTMASYTASVHQMRTEFGTTTAEAAALTQQISKMGDSTASIKSLANTFTIMGRATGESSTALATSMMNLQRTMGTPQRDAKRYGDQLVSLAANANTSAEGLANFASSIGPIGRTIGLSQTAVTGVSKAFVKAGQDGYSAGNAFNKIVGDIAYASATGSPQLALYANLVGKTVKQFESMSGQEKVVSIFDRLASLGPKAVTELNRMGLDGVRYAKAITAVSQSGGGIGQAINEAEGAFGSGSARRGQKAADAGLTDEYQKLREEMKLTAESFGSLFGPAVAGGMKSLEKLAGVIRMVSESPLGKLAQGVGALAGGLASLAGGALLAVPALMKLAGVFTLARSSASYGVREGFGGASRITPDRDPVTGARLGTFSGGGVRGREIASDPRSTWTQRWMYNRGIRAGAPVGSAFRGAESMGWQRGAEGRQGTLGSFFFPRDASGAPVRGGARASAAFSAVPYGAAAFMRNFINPQYDQARHQSVPDRASWMGHHGPLMKPQQATVDRLDEATRKAEERLRHRSDPANQFNKEVIEQTKQEVKNAKAVAEAERKRLNNLNSLSTSTKDLDQEQRSTSKGFKALRDSFKDFGKANAATAGAGAGVAGSMAGRGAGALGRGLGRAAGSSLGQIGIGLAIFEAIDLLSKEKPVDETDYSGSGDAYMQAGDITPISFAPTAATPKTAKLKDTKRIDDETAAYAKSSRYKIKDKAMEGMSATEAKNYLAASWGQYATNPEARQLAIMDMAAAGVDPAQINRIVTDLDKGYKSNVEEFAKPVEFDRIGGDISRVTTKSAGLAVGTLQSRAEQAGDKGGMRGYTKSLNEGYLGILDRMTPKQQQQPNALIDIGKNEDTQAINRVFKDMLGGLELSNKEMHKIFYTQGEGEDRAKKLTSFGGVNVVKEGGSAGIAGAARGGESQRAGWLDLAKEADTPKEMRKANEAMLEAMKTNLGKTKYEEEVAPGMLNKYGAFSKSLAPEKVAEAIYKVQTQAAKDDKSANEEMAGNIAKLGEAGETFAKSMTDPKGAIFKLLDGQEGNLRAQERAIRDSYGALKGTEAQKLKNIDEIAAASEGNEQSPTWQIAQAMKGMAKQQQGVQNAMLATPTEQWAARTEQNVATISNRKDQSETAIKERKAAEAAIIEDTVNQALALKQQMIAQQQFDTSVKRSWEDIAIQKQQSLYDFNLSRARAEEDFNRQQKWQLEDYNRSRKRMEQDYQLSRSRANFDFNLSMKRSQEDFNLSRKRQEQDYQHSIVLMVEASAKSMMDIYKRVQVQQTHSAMWLLTNSAEQVNRMQKQAADLEKLRKMGMKDDTIQQLGLTDPANQQQLARFVNEMSENPELVKDFNKNVSKRLKAAKKLVTDESSSEWEEFTRQHKLQTTRATNDFERNTGRAIRDHRRQMDRMAFDYRKTLGRMGEDLHTAMGRSLKLFGIQMSRSAEDYQTMIGRMIANNVLQLKRAREDINTVAEGMSGDIYDTFTKAAQTLKGKQGELARAALRDLKEMGNSLARVDHTIAVEFWTMFDLPGKAPKLREPFPGISSDGNRGSPASPRSISPANRASGGVLDGYTPGIDIHHYKSKTGGDLHLSGGEAIMVPEWTKQVGGAGVVAEMNRRARNGADNHGVFHASDGTHFARGGLYRPVRGGSPGGLHDSYTGYPATDVGIPTGSKVAAGAAGRVTESRDIRGYEPRSSHGGLGYRSYGRVIKIDHGGYETLYAHLSQRGVGAGAHVEGGKVIGLSGSTGHTYGAHLHFGSRGRSPFDFFGGSTNYSGAVGNVGRSGGIVGISAAPAPTFESMTKKIYEKLEAEAADVHIGGEQFDRGWWSDRVNKYAKIRYNKLARQWRRDHPAGSGMFGVGAVSGNFGGNAAGVWNALKAAGFNKIHSAGIMGNMLHESGFDPHIVQGGGHSMDPRAAGGGGYGLVQWTPGSKLIPYLHGKPPSVATEISALAAQLAGRGPSPEGGAGRALAATRTVPAATIAFETKYERHADPPIQPGRQRDAQAIYRRFAAEGALINGPTDMTLGESGPEAVIPLNQRGVDYMAELMQKVTSGTEAKNGFVNSSTPVMTTNVYNYRVDKSTNFTGPISVNASNPREMLAQLQAQQRLKALSQPVLARSA